MEQVLEHHQKIPRLPEPANRFDTVTVVRMEGTSPLPRSLPLPSIPTVNLPHIHNHPDMSSHMNTAISTPRSDVVTVIKYIIMYD